MTAPEKEWLAEMILAIRKKYDALFSSPLPLMMVLQPGEHFYIEFLPLQRNKEKLKYLATVETSLGTFLE